MLRTRVVLRGLAILSPQVNIDLLQPNWQFHRVYDPMVGYFIPTHQADLIYVGCCFSPR